MSILQQTLGTSFSDRPGGTASAASGGESCSLPTGGCSKSTIAALNDLFDSYGVLGDDALTTTLTDDQWTALIDEALALLAA